MHGQKREGEGGQRCGIIPSIAEGPAGRPAPIIRGRRFPPSHLEPVNGVILASGWSAWVYLCGTLNVTCWEVHTLTPFCPWVAWSQHLLPNSSWFHLSTTSLLSSILHRTQGWLCLILGDTHMLSLLPATWFSTHHILVGSSVGGSMKDHIAHPALPYSMSIDNQESGGVIEGSWNFSSNRPFSTESTFGSSQGKRCLGHVINKAIPVRRCQYAAAPKQVPASAHKNSHLPLDWSKPIPIGSLRSLVHCPSVFASTGWVCRPLSLPELMSVFDVPPVAQPPGLRQEEDTGSVSQQKEDTGSASPTQDIHYPFMVAPPIKVLQRAYEQWGQHQNPILYEVRSANTCNPTSELASLVMYPNLMTDMPSSKIITSEDDFKIATKSDDAHVPVHLWNDRIWKRNSHSPLALAQFHQLFPSLCPLEAIPSLLLRCWRRRVCRSLVRFLRSTYGEDWSKGSNTSDLVAGRQCPRHAAAADWWEWRQGSTLFFWRWPKYAQSLARDGHPLWIRGQLPSYRRPQKMERDLDLREKVRSKLESVRDKGYLIKGEVKSLTGYFAVPKGPADIRMVYDATKSGLNQALWAPSFSLPSTEALTDLLDASAWMADMDMGEMFLNFPLDPLIRPYCGLDL
jgi:hypothetical protein